MNEPNLEDAKVRRFRWRHLEGDGVEFARFTSSNSGVWFSGRVIGRSVVEYIIECDRKWRTRYVMVRSAGRQVQMFADGVGHWTDADGTSIHDLDGAIDVDISATPISNTLPIRRLDLSNGVSADIVTAYIPVPQLKPVPDPQRYTRLSEDAYRYDSRDSDFTREITIDSEGFVVSYPGLFVREAP